jgi:hypothetical protein
MIHWPSVVWSLALSESLKKKTCLPEPWRAFGRLLHYRALGSYSLKEYHAYIQPRLHSSSEKLKPILAAIIPGVVANSLLVLRHSLSAGHDKGAILEYLRQSRFYWRRWLEVSRAR